MAKLLKPRDYLNKQTRPLRYTDFSEGLRDALPEDSTYHIYDAEDSRVALEWLRAQIAKKNVNHETFDKEFKKILSDLNKAEKNGEQIAEYRPTVKKAIGYIRKAIEYRWATRVWNKGHSEKWNRWNARKPF